MRLGRPPLTPGERRREVARLLAGGVLRLRALLPADPGPTAGSPKLVRFS